MASADALAALDSHPWAANRHRLPRRVGTWRKQKNSQCFFRVEGFPHPQNHETGRLGKDKAARAYSYSLTVAKDRGVRRIRLKNNAH
jgi:hypothetical protein